MATPDPLPEDYAAAQRLALRDWHTWAAFAAFIAVAFVSVPVSTAAPLKIGGINLTMAVGAGLGGGLFGWIHARRVRAHQRALSRSRQAAV